MISAATSLTAVLRAVRAERAVIAALAGIVSVTAFLVAAVPGLLTSRYDAAARDAVAQVPPAARDVTVTAFIGGRTGPPPPIHADGGMRAVAARIAAATPAALRAVTGPVEYAIAGRPVALPLGQGAPPDRTDPSRRLLLERDPGVAGRVRYVAGRPPRNPASGRAAHAGAHPVIEAGLAATTAAPLQLRAGAEVPLTLGTTPVIVRITGLYRPLGRDDRFWPARPSLTAPIVERGRDGDPQYTGVGVLDAAGYQALYDETDAQLDFTWRLPVRPGAFTAARVRPVAGDLARLGVAAGSLEMVTPGLTADSTRPQVQTGLTGVLAGFRAQLGAARAVLSLALAGLFAVAFGALALTCRLLIERLRGPLAVLRARGASPAQLGGGVGAGAFLVALPAATVGYAAAAAVPGAAAWRGPVAVVGAAALVPAALAARTRSRPARELARPRGTPRRLVLDALVVMLAVAGVAALRARGLTTDAADRGTDPFLAAVPVLLACAAGLLTLRAYPYPLRLAGRLTARGRSAVAFIGVARSARQGTAAALPMIVLLLAVAVAAFAGVVDTGVRGAQERSAWQSVGADARIDGPGFDAAAIGRIRRVPGVRDVAPAQFIDGATLRSPARMLDVTIVTVDLAAYRRLAARTPLRLPAAPPGEAGGPPGSAAPALMSPGLARELGPGPYLAAAALISDLPVRPAGVVDAFPATHGPFVVVPYRSLGREATATTLFVGGRGLDPGRLRAAAGDAAQVTTWAGALDRLTGSPMLATVRAAFGYGVLALAGYATIVILLALILGSYARGQAVAYLRTLGLSRRQARGLAVAELGPALLAAGLAGWAVGLLLPHLLGSAVDLRPYTGGIAPAGYAPDPLTTAVLAGGLILFGGLAISVDAMIGVRRRLGTALRMGAQT
ncbi:MAG TPA: FtsX-like permease family protein [Streptosporangiaceae bacterium]